MSRCDRDIHDRHDLPHFPSIEWRLGLICCLAWGLLLVGRDTVAQDEGIEDLEEEVTDSSGEQQPSVSPDSRGSRAGVQGETILTIEELPASRRDQRGAASSARASAPIIPPTHLSADYALRLQELEDRVNELREQIFRSKSRLVLLREQVLRSTIAGCQAVITHVNEMGVTFNLEQVVYSLDGNQLFTATDRDGELSDREEFEVYTGALLPGPHNLAVEMVFVGNGFGLFSYLEGYRFRLRSSYAFHAEDGKVANLRVIAYEQGGINQPIEERPDIRYQIDFTDATTQED